MPDKNQRRAARPTSASKRAARLRARAEVREQRAKRARALDRAFFAAGGICRDVVLRCFDEVLGNGRGHRRSALGLAFDHPDLAPLRALLHQHAVPRGRPRLVRFRRLAVAAARGNSALLQPPMLHGLWRLTARPWVRAPTDWSMASDSADVQYQRLVAHVALRYRTAPFLARCLWQSEAEAALFDWVADGRSVSEAVACGLLPVPLTRKMCHHLANLQTTRLTLVEAVRTAQIGALGGGPALRQALRATDLGRSFQDNEAFWQAVITWFCRAETLDAEDRVAMNNVGPLVDWFRSERARAADWSPSGRTPASAVRGMLQWHRTLGRSQQVVTNAPLPASGLQPGSWALLDATGSGGSAGSGATDASGDTGGPWIIVDFSELRSTQALAAEGQAMRHCVYSYARRIMSGRTSIWSLGFTPAREQDDEIVPVDKRRRRLTLEVDHTKRAVVQIRGPSNRRVTPAERPLVKRWAEANGLVVKRHA